MGHCREGSCLLAAAPTIYPQRATNHLDPMPGWEPGSKGFTYWHSHHRLLACQLLFQPTNSTTAKDAYCLLHKAPLWGQGEAEHPSQAVCPQKRQQGGPTVGLTVPSLPSRAAGGHAGVHALPQIQPSLCSRVPPTPGVMPWRGGPCCGCLPRAEGGPQS